MTRTGWTAPAGTAGVAAACALAVRPRMVRWGASEEVSAHFPGFIIERATRSTTMATTVDAPPEAVC